MAWELIKSFGTRGMRIGEFTVRGKTFCPKLFEDKSFNWYMDKKILVAKMQIDKNGLKKVHATVTIPNPIQKMIAETQFICYLDEDTIYVSPYSKGQEYLEKILRIEKVLK
jgi:hypothetical protein